MRSVGAAVRAAERDAERRRKQQLKAQIASDAASAVRNWENYISTLVRVHTHQSESVPLEPLP